MMSTSSATVPRVSARWKPPAGRFLYNGNASWAAVVRQEGSREGFADIPKRFRNVSVDFEHYGYGKGADRSFYAAGQGKGIRSPHGFEAGVEKIVGDKNGLIKVGRGDRLCHKRVCSLNRLVYRLFLLQ
ncbi:hypothetical protein SUGI_0233170 [Cryptomeria japonica]|nr:hypothetical protein SUGI_0233170 [Cryptomeria japonica]